MRNKQNRSGFFISPHPLTNFEIQRYYQNKPRFNGVYSRNDLPKIIDEAYLTNLKILTINQLITLFVTDDKVRAPNKSTYFDSFRDEQIPKDIKRLIGQRNITANVFTIQAYDSIMCTYFCIGFIDFVLKGQSLLEYTNLFSRNKYEKK